MEIAAQCELALSNATNSFALFVIPRLTSESLYNIGRRSCSDDTNFVHSTMFRLRANIDFSTWRVVCNGFNGRNCVLGSFHSEYFVEDFQSFLVVILDEKVRPTGTFLVVLPLWSNIFCSFERSESHFLLPRANSISVPLRNFPDKQLPCILEEDSQLSPL